MRSRDFAVFTNAADDLRHLWAVFVHGSPHIIDKNRFDHFMHLCHSHVSSSIPYAFKSSRALASPPALKDADLLRPPALIRPSSVSSFRMSKSYPFQHRRALGYIPARSGFFRRPGTRLSSQDVRYMSISVKSLIVSLSICHPPNSGFPHYYITGNPSIQKILKEKTGAHPAGQECHLWIAYPGSRRWNTPHGYAI